MILVVALPSIVVLPPKKAHVTPTGRLSSKAWTKTELNEVYANLIGAHLLATIRETLIVGRCITNARIIGACDLASGGVEPLFDVDIERSGDNWADDDSGRRVLGHAKFGLRTGGRTQEVQPWSLAEMRADVAAITA